MVAWEAKIGNGFEVSWNVNNRAQLVEERLVETWNVYEEEMEPFAFMLTGDGEVRCGALNAEAPAAYTVRLSNAFVGGRFTG